MLIGKRIFLSAFEADDISARYISWLNDPVVVKYSNQRFYQHTYRTSLNYLNEFVGTNNLFYKVSLRADNEVIGTLTVYNSIEHGRSDMGIMIGDRAYWNQGYGLETWCLTMNWLLEEKKVRKVTAGAAIVNQAMINIFNKSKMKLDCIRKKHEVIENKAVDMHYYAKFNSKF